jgi:formamidopyrimidine-DNA glycosylase
MPELPDIAAYIDALEARIVGRPIERIRVASPFLLRTATPPLHTVEGRVVRELRRIGKRIAIGVDGDVWLVLHLMIAGRLHWRPRDAKLGGRQNLAAFDFPDGSIVLTEAGSKKRASLHVFSAQQPWRRSIREESKSSPATWILFASRSPARIALSSERSPTRALSVASAMLIPMKFCTQLNFRLSR